MKYRTPKSKGWSKDYVAIEVKGKEFTDAEVILDGHHYHHCVFVNVTFVYNGTTPIRLHDNDIHAFEIKSDNPAINAIFALLFSLQQFRRDVRIPHPEGGTIWN